MTRGVTAGLLLGVLACADPAAPGQPTGPDLELRIWPTGPQSLLPGDSLTAYVRVTDRETGAVVPAASISLASSNPAVATVRGVPAGQSPQGPVSAGALITALSTGTAAITARYQGASGDLQVTVAPAPDIGSLIMEGPYWNYLDYEGALLWQGESVELYVHSSNGVRLEDATVVWSVDQPDVARVQGFVGPIRHDYQRGTQGGLVTGLSSGVVTVTARVGAATAKARIAVASRPAAIRIAGPMTLSPGSSANLRLEAQDAATGTWFFAPGATWSSTNSAVVCLGWPYVSQYGSSCQGAEAKSAGTTVIRATLLGLEASKPVTVLPLDAQIVMRDPTAPRALRFRLDGSAAAAYPTTQQVTGALALSPDARVLAYVCPVGLCIESQDALGVITSPANSPSWYPTVDGSLRLAYQADSRTVAIVDFPTGIAGPPRELSRIVTSQLVQSPVSPRHPGGPFVAQCSGDFPPGFWHVCQFGSDGLVGQPLFTGLSPAWGPGDRLAWCDGHCYVRPGPLDPPGAARTVYESASGFYPEVAWSPDGNFLFVVDAGRVYLAAADGSGWTRLLQWSVDTGWGDPETSPGPRLTPSWR